ncbi:MAG: hypothetical protein GC160_15000 [Acidobacteria bacterium]|nr:hypothetical protein [Acidobacteriota bacterium]
MVKSPSDLPNHPDGGYISSSLRLDGEISGNADLYIDGAVNGKIDLGERKLTVGESGRIEAEIQVGEATVRGRIEGSVDARDRIEISPTGDIQGQLRARRIVVADGAKLRGKVDVGGQIQAAVERKGPQAVAPTAPLKAKTAG